MLNFYSSNDLSLIGHLVIHWEPSFSWVKLQGTALISHASMLRKDGMMPSNCYIFNVETPIVDHLLMEYAGA